MNRTLVSAPNLSYFSLANNCYANLFQSCNLLESMPILPAKTLAENCYAYMFQSCSNIKKASTLPAKNIPNNAYTAIFSYISSLNNITCLAISKQQSSFTFWLDSVAQQGILNVSKTDIFPENTSSGKPNGWEFNVVNNIGSGLYIRNASVYTNSVYHKIKNPYFVLSGSDSEINGRGLLNSSTLFNMLDTNPLYNNGVTFDTYNKDGSFNQEVWGYKCFNSPVMFRNGIYGECSSLTTWPNSDYNYLSEHNYYIDQNDDKFALNELCGSYLSCPNKEMHAEYNGIDMYTPDGIITVTPESAIASAHANFINTNSQPGDDAGVIVSQSLIASKHSVLNTSNLSRLLCNSELNNAIPDRSAVVCTNTHTKVGIRDGEYHLSFTTNTAMLGSKSDERAAYVLAESTINSSNNEENKVIVSADKIINKGILFGNIPIVDNEHSIYDSFNDILPVGGLYIFQVGTQLNSDYYVWPGMAIKPFEDDIYFTQSWYLETNPSEDAHTFPITVYFFNLNAATNEYGNQLLVNMFPEDACFVAISPAQVNKNGTGTNQFNSTSFYAIRIK
jgi:hypothetical protein